MGVVSYIADRLANVMTGRGTSIDKRTGNIWMNLPITPDQVEAAYRNNWLCKKIVDIPAKDMTREGRAWQAKGTKIEDIEAEEMRLQLWPKLLRVQKLARLYGGGALILSTGEPDPMQPLSPERTGKGGLKFVHVMNRWELNLGQKITDPESEWYGKPEYYQMNANNQQQVKLHPSRVIEFIGQPPPEGAMFTQSDSWFWGDPILQSINEVIEDAMTATGGFAALIDEAKLDVIKIPDLMASVGTQEYEDRLMTRLALANTGKSSHRALIIDGAEEWDHRQVNWAGIPAVMNAFLEVVAGAADIPVTRLLGQSPKGLQSTGKGEQDDYHAKVMADQGELLRPQLERLDEILIRSALGTRPDDVYWEFNSLDRPDEKEDSAIEKERADTLKIYGDMGIFEDEAIAAIAKNAMIESGRWPGCEEAFEANPDVPEDEPGPDDGKTAAELAAEKVEAMRVAGAVDDAQAVALITDARPRSLYVSRKLLNGRELLAWAKGQGIPEPMDAADLHVTILYSKQAVDWLKMDSAWNENDKGQLTVRPGGARLVERLGDKGAVVLLFSASALSWRHEEMVRQGANHDFDTYQPHITVSWNVPADFDLDAVEPYRGKLVLGPEIFAEIDEDWVPPVKAA